MIQPATRANAVDGRNSDGALFYLRRLRLGDILPQIENVEYRAPRADFIFDLIFFAHNFRSQLDGFMHDALTATLATRAKAGFIFMSSNRGDMGPEAKSLPGTGVYGSRAFIEAHPDVTKRFAQSLRGASSAWSAAPRADMVAIMAEWSRQDPAVIDDLYDQFDPRIGMTPEAAQVWWDILGSAMVARGEISPKLKFADMFDLSYLRPRS